MCEYVNYPHTFNNPFAVVQVARENNHLISLTILQRCGNTFRKTQPSKKEPNTTHSYKIIADKYLNVG